MKRFFIITFVLLLTAIVGTLGYIKFVLPGADAAPDIKVELTPERIQRGEYLAFHVAACMDCHSSRDWSRFSGPLVDGTLGLGGEYFGPELGFPGKFYSKNLTPSHLGDWTDGEIFRAITSGVDRQGKALFPVMPYLYYAKMNKEDILDIIAYIRSLSPLENKIPESEADFPMNFIINTMPGKPMFTQKPDRQNKVEYGKYLVNVASCVDCHTPVNNGQIIAEKAFSGGREFELPGGILRSANITPDVATGIGSWTDSVFVSRFKAYQNLDSLPQVEQEGYNTLMPWTMYAGMERADLEAIHAYLKTLAPIENEIIRWYRKSKNQN